MATGAVPQTTKGHGYVPLQEIPYRGHWLVERAVLRHTKQGDRVFDGGVSSGYLAQRFVDAGRIVDGAEIDSEAARQAGAMCDRVWVGDLQALDVAEIDRTYQVILFADTLEHLSDPPSVLQRLGTRLEPGGTLIVSLPNIANWLMRLGLLIGRFQYTDRGILDRTHLRFYTKKTAVEMLRQGGFDPVKIEGSIPVPLVRSPRLCHLAHLIGNLRSSLFAYSFVLTARRSPA